MNTIQIILFSLLFSLTLTFCKEKTKPNDEPQKVQTDKVEKIRAIAMFMVGEVKVSDKNLKYRDIIEEGQEIVTGKKSSCDLQIISPKTEITIRLRENSKLMLQNLRGKDFSIFIGRGKALFNVAKNQQNLIYVTPTAVAGVRGTKFELSVDEKLSSGLSVYEGRVSDKIRISEFEKLPDVIQTSIPIKKLSELINNEEIIVDTGSRILLEKSMVDKILKVSNLSGIIQNTPPTDLESKLKEVKLEALEKELAELKGKVMPKPESIPAEDIKSKLEECKELIAISMEKLSDPTTMIASIEERNKTVKEQLLKRIESVMGKPVQTIVLKNGKKIQGVIGDTKDKDKYTVVTTEGITEIPTIEVENIEF